MKIKIRSELKDKSYRQLKGKLNWYFATPFLNLVCVNSLLLMEPSLLE